MSNVAIVTRRLAAVLLNREHVLLLICQTNRGEYSSTPWYTFASRYFVSNNVTDYVVRAHTRFNSYV